MAYETTYTAVGNREDLSDIITNISPTQTPIYSLIGRTVAKATYHEWLEDELAAPGANAQVEGADFSGIIQAPTARVRKGNYTQIFSKGYGVSGTQEVVLKAGIKSEIAYQMAKAMKEIARDVEYAIITNAAAVAGDATTARQMGGIPAFVTTNVTDAGGVALTEDMLNDAIQASWKAGGEPDTVVVSGKNKRAISGFTAGVTKTVSADDKRLIAAVDVYESDFGMVKIIADRWMPDTDLFVLDKSYLKVAYLRPFKQEEVAKTGDRTEKVIVGELTLEVRAEKAQARITNLG
jgi:hypothetical protein